jgi:tetratricopeptide (TPR) repeat protein
MKTVDKALRYYQLADDFATRMYYSKAIIYYKQSLSLYLSLAKHNPAEHGLPIAHIFSNLSIIYMSLEELKRCEELHENALKMYRVLVKTNYQKYAPELVSCLIDGVRYLNQHTITLYEAKIVLTHMEKSKKRDDLKKVVHKLQRTAPIN